MMTRAKIYLKENGNEEFLKEASFPCRPSLGDKFDEEYKIISISDPHPIGRNISAGEPDMGIRIIICKI